MARTWRVAILGLGHWYSAYGLARALVEYPRAELVAAAWHDRARLDAFATTFRVAGYERAEDLLDREDVDIVHLACPVSAMEELTVLAARRGKHIVLGKPMAMTLPGADRMVEAVESAAVTCVPFQAIMRLRLGAIKERIGSGQVGTLILLHQTSRWSIAEDWYRSGTPGWFADPQHVPGGAFIDEGIYWIDCFGWLCGSRIVRVDARMGNLVHKELAVEDWGLATFTFENGVIGTLEAAWTIAAPRRSGPSPKQNSVVRLEVIGDRGEIVDQSFRVPGRAVLAAGASDWVFERHADEPFAPPAPSPLDHLLDCLERGLAPIATIRDARASLAVALAAYQAAREDRPVLL
jgi:predicted dehydrogenase